MANVGNVLCKGSGRVEKVPITLQNLTTEYFQLENDSFATKTAWLKQDIMISFSGSGLHFNVAEKDPQIAICKTYNAGFQEGGGAQIQTLRLPFRI